MLRVSILRGYSPHLKYSNDTFNKYPVQYLLNGHTSIPAQSCLAIIWAYWQLCSDQLVDHNYALDVFRCGFRDPKRLVAYVSGNSFVLLMMISDFKLLVSRSHFVFVILSNTHVSMKKSGIFWNYLHWSCLPVNRILNVITTLVKK